MWRLHRYYLRELLVNAGMTFAVLFAIVLISLVARGIQRAQGGGLLDAAKITFLWALDAFPHLLPIAFLLATVLTFARAANDREITAVRSAGISPRVPMTASVLVGLMLSIIGSLSMHYLVPEAHFHKYRVVAEVARNTVIAMGLSSTDDRITIPGTGVTMTYGAREAGSASESFAWTDCWLYLPNRMLEQYGNYFSAPILHVDRVSMPEFDEGSTELVIRMEGVSDPMNADGFEWELIAPTFPIRDVSDINRRDERDSDMASDQLLAEVIRGMHDSPVAAEYTLHRRTSFAILSLLLGPIGFCIALAVRDRGRAVALVGALIPLALFYIGDVLGAKLVRVTALPEFGWTPTAILVGLGVPFCWRELVR